MKRGFLSTGNLFLCKQKGGAKWQKMKKHKAVKYRPKKNEPRLENLTHSNQKDKWKDLCNRDIF